MTNLSLEETYCIRQRGKHVRVRILHVVRTCDMSREHILFRNPSQKDGPLEYAVVRIDNGKQLDKHRKASEFMCAGQCRLTR